VGYDQKEQGEKRMMSIYINGWETNMKFSAAHFIPYHDKCKRLHGHDYAIDIRIEGELLNGMVADFVTVKKETRKLLEEIDHKLILPVHGKDMEQEKEGDHFIIKYEGKTMSIPEEFVYLCDIDYSSSEELSRFFASEITKKVKFEKNVKLIEVSVYEGPGQKASWSEKIG
jgi:6-pyruvoyltetrahydropterin/6-carboxytetrahydropterin synthase